MKKDITMKEVLTTLAEDIAKYILNLNISQVSFVDKELQRIEKREADLVAKCRLNGKTHILHIYSRHMKIPHPEYPPYRT